MPRSDGKKITGAIQAPATTAIGSAPDAPAPSRLPMALAIAFALGVLLLVASTISVVIRTYTPLPRLDQWTEVLWVRNYYAGHAGFATLWQQHNEHRIFFPMLFLLADWFLFRGTNLFLYASMFLLQAAHAWIFIREFRVHQFSRVVRLVVIAWIVALFFSGANLENFTWPFQISFILTFYAGTLSLYALLRGAGQTGSAAARWFAASLACGIVATYSLASGILIWPVLLLAGLMVKLRRRFLLAIGAVFALLVPLYFFHYHFVPGHTNPRDALQHPFSLLAYVCAYLALPLASINHIAGVVAGVAVLIALAWETVRVLRRPAPSRLAALCLGVMLYITAGGFVTALGRVSMGPPEAAARYATPVSIFWVCALLLVLVETETFPWRSVAVAATLAAAITALGITILPLHRAYAARYLQDVPPLREAEAALLVGIDAGDRLAPLFPPDPALPLALAPVLRQHHRSLFASTPVAVGKPLPLAYRFVSPSLCRGAWEFTTSLPGSDLPGESISGWAWENASGRTPRMVLMLDQAHAIQGFARFTQDRQDVAAAWHNDALLSSGWFGFARRLPLRASYQAYLLLHDGQSLCPLPSPADLSRSVFAIFRRGEWTINTTKTGEWSPRDRTLHFGIPGDIPVAGDWDGSGVTRAGVYRNGQWYLDWNNNGQWDPGDRQGLFGLPGDLPVVGDWNHTGTTKVGVFRNGTWILDWTGELRYGPASRQFHFGAPGDIPVAGDWDGSGRTRIGVYRNGVWILDMNGNFQFDSGDKVIAFGLPGDQPVTGDWNGLGVARPGVFRDGSWILDSNGNQQLDVADHQGTFGLPGDIAVSWK